MNAQTLTETARALVAGDKGLLAMDESNPTCNKRFATLGIPQTVEARRAYRELIVTTKDVYRSIISDIWRLTESRPCCQRGWQGRPSSDTNCAA